MLTNKVIVITGGSSGIGKAMAISCAENNASVFIGSLNNDKLQSALDEFKQAGLNIKGVKTDVRQLDEVKSLGENAYKALGEIDVWINNAGIAEGYRYFTDISEQEIHNIWDTNIKGCVLGSKVALSFFDKQKAGILINMAGRGSNGKAVKHMSQYAASKAAVLSFTKSIAAEYKQTAICICAYMPGMVKTDLVLKSKLSTGLEKDMEKLPRVLDTIGSEPEEVGRALVKFLFKNPYSKHGKIVHALPFTQLIKGVIKLIFTT